VAETARAAAFDDPRFPPLTAGEVHEIRISLSILSPLSPILPEQVEMGRHGLMVSLAGQRGLLLPQVPIEHRWDRTTFLEQTCRKAGLPPDAWKQDAVLHAFTAEVFADDDLA
jgi:AmmeMemoRadiSam system protein A